MASHRLLLVPTATSIILLQASASLAICATVAQPLVSPPGDYTLHLGYAFGSGDVVNPVPVTIVGGQTTTVSFDVSNAVGIVTGNFAINGQPPPEGYGVCSSSP